MMRRLTAAFLALLFASLALPRLLFATGEGPARAAAPKTATVRIPAGSYRPLYTREAPRARVAAFEIDRYAVSEADFLAFVRANSKWRRSEVKAIFTEPSYLSGWQGDLDPGPGAAERPVTNVSWFAAKAYCGWRDMRLPTASEWEYVAAADEAQRDASDDAAFRQRLLSLYTRSRRGEAPRLGSGFRNAYGIHDLHGVVWEWVQDFNNLLVTGDSRGHGAEKGVQLFCAAGSIGTSDPADYAAFLRYGFRAGLNARATTGNLGFRCVSDLP